MSIGLLAPLFLAGLAAVAIPILVHLVRREEQAPLAFPSLMFLSAIPVREHRRRSIRHWWLLLLRCLIVALLCLAFAQPFIQWPADRAGAAGGQRDRIILLDRSMSMQAGSQWQNAVVLAGDAIDALSAGDRGALLLFDHDTLLAQELSADHGALRSALAGAQSGDGHTDLAGAIARASALLEESPAAKRDIVVISDFQQSAVASGEALRVAPGIDIIPRPLTEAREANAAVAAVTLHRKALGAGDAVELTARIVNPSPLPIEDADLIMQVDGQDRERRIVSLAPGEARDELFRLVLAPDELLRVRILLGDDALAADNSFHLLVSGPTAIAVLLVEDRGTAPEHTLHLSEALGQGDTPGFRVTRRYVSQLRDADIDNADVIVINDAPMPAGSLGDHLRAFLQSGGGLLVVAAGRTQGAWPNDADGIVPGQLGSTISRAQGDAARIVHMDSLHPALATFAGNDGGDLGAAQVFRYRRLTAVGDEDVLARYDDENIAMAQRRVGAGRVLVITTTLDPSWNTLALQPGYLPLVHEAFKYLAAHVTSAPAMTVGESVDLESYARGLPGYTQSAAALARGTITTLRTPSGRQLHLPPGEAFANAGEAGFYEAHVGGGGARSLVFAANPLPGESDLTPLDVQALVSSIGKDTSGEATVADTRSPARTRSDDRAWQLLLLLCALLLGVDSVLSNRLSRRVAAA